MVTRPKPLARSTPSTPRTSRTPGSDISASRPPRFAIAKADLIEGMAKGMAVLESFDTQRQRLNATLAAGRAGITRTAARRHLLTLTHLGYLETDGSYFWLSAKVLRFSGSFLATARLPRAVQPELNRLALQTQESFSVAVLDGAEVVIVGRSGTEWKNASDNLRPGFANLPRTTAYGLHLGARLPAHATSTGRVLLAGQSKSAVNAWLKARAEAGGLARLTLHTVTDTRKLRAVIDQVRVDDYCIANEEHELGVQALAVPLRNLPGQTVAALNVVSAPGRMSADGLRRDLLPLLLDAARKLRGLL